MTTADRRAFLKLCLLAAAGGVSSCAGGEKSGGPVSRNLAASVDSAAACCGARGWGVWQDGRLLTGANEGTAGPSLSITKSLAGLAVCRGMDEGWLDPAERAATTITEWAGDARKSRITVRMLLQQISGLDAGVIPLYRAHPADKGRTAVSLPCVDEPGSVFRYGPGHWELLGEILRRKLVSRRLTLRSFMDKAVLRPIGLRTANWRSDGNGNPYLSTGVEFTIGSLGRLGRTLVRLLSGENCDGFSATDYQNVIRPSAVNPMFGGGLWANRNAARGACAIEVEKHLNDPQSAGFWRGSCLSNRQPAELVALIGSNGKRLYLWPSRKLVIARLGASANWSDQHFLAAVAE